MKIAVIGTGYVGLVTGTCFAESGHQVTCVDTDKRKVDMLKAGEIPIYEPGLDDLVARNTKGKRLHFTTDTAAAVAGAEIIFLAVGTPPREDGAADLSYLFQAAETIAAALTGPAVLVTKSTVPVGTARKLWNLLQQKTQQPFDVVSNPEFLKEGDAVSDFMKPDRVVVGCQSERARKVMADLYEPFVRTDNPILFMDLESSEMTKYAANAFLATKISFMNEMARLCQATGADVETVRKGISFDRRIGHHFMFPGVGYGGSCFPKDVKALVALGAEKKIPMRILDAVEEVNEEQKSVLVEKLVQRLGGNLKGKTIALWGIAFKPKTDDIREAPALVIIEKLKAMGAQVRVTDPVAIPNAKVLLGASVEYSEDPYAILEGADALLVVTEWNEFRRPDFLRMRGLMRTPVLLDGRNVYEPEAMRALGFDYAGIGRGRS
jgi:UDPglucose 6-dehydrogenase